MARASGHFIPLIPQAILDCPPSVADKTLSYDEELGQRLFGCEWIQKASILLSVRTEAMCNGQITFHRFYYKRSMREFDVKLVAAGCLFLGCKLAETPRSVNDFVYLSLFLDWLHFKEKELKGIHETVEETQKVLELTESRFQAFLEKEKAKPRFCHTKTNLHRIERHILRETGFRISEVLVLPHRTIIQYIHCLFGDVAQAWCTSVVQSAWGYLNDALRLPLCCMFQPPCLTIAAIYLAVLDNGLQLPEKDDWMTYFDVTFDEMMSVIKSLKKLYTIDQAEYRVLANPPLPPPSNSIKTTSEEKKEGDTTPHYRCLDTSTHLDENIKNQINRQLREIEQRHTYQASN